LKWLEQEVHSADVALLNKYTTFMFTSINKQEDFKTNLLRFIEELSPIDTPKKDF